MANVITCADGRPSVVNFNGNSVSVSQIWNTIVAGTTFKYCVEITDLTDEPDSATMLYQLYTNCYDCLYNNFTVVSVSDCFEQISGIEIIYPSFAIPPSFGNVFSGTILIGGKAFTSCWKVERITQISEDEYNKSIVEGFVGYTTVPVTSFFSNCTDCITGATLPYAVRRCTDENIDCVGLVNGENIINNLISYSDGINQYCGTVIGTFEGVCTLEYTFINDFGVKEPCEKCLSQNSVKIKLENCIDPNITQVVWGSSLFGIGEATSLSTDDGCFRVLGTTNEEVTINYYLNFDPQPTCQNCIECNGYTIVYESCDGMSINQSVSYQYIGVGEFFYHPVYGCSEVTTVNPGIGLGDTLYSFPTFTSCVDCQMNADFRLFGASACTESMSGLTFNLLVPTSYSTPGNTFVMNWGSTPFVCATLLEGEYSGDYFYSNTLTTCEECLTSSYIGMNAINCSTGEVTLYKFNQNDYGLFYNNIGLTDLNSFKYNGQCYFISNLCPQPTTGELVQTTEFYGLCFECTPDPIDPPRSANTESLMCEVCCPCTTGSTITSVNPYHPVWTDGRGISVTQLNMVTLGGENGLNN